MARDGKKTWNDGTDGAWGNPSRRRYCAAWAPPDDYVRKPCGSAAVRFDFGDEDAR